MVLAIGRLTDLIMQAGTDIVLLLRIALCASNAQFNRAPGDKSMFLGEEGGAACRPTPVDEIPTSRPWAGGLP